MLATISIEKVREFIGNNHRLLKSFESYSKYGKEGPPVGSYVETIIWGFGGPPGQRLVYVGMHEDSKHMLLGFPDKTYQYFATASKWWTEFCVISEGYITKKNIYCCQCGGASPFLISPILLARAGEYAPKDNLCYACRQQCQLPGF